MELDGFCQRIGYRFTDAELLRRALTHRSYGASHTERYEKETFAHWEFATGTGEQVKEIAQYFGLTYFPEKDQIIHALRTVIVSPEGKVVKTYVGNEWKIDDVVAEIKKSAAR